MCMYVSEPAISCMYCNVELMISGVGQTHPAHWMALYHLRTCSQPRAALWFFLDTLSTSRDANSLGCEYSMVLGVRKSLIVQDVLQLHQLCWRVTGGVGIAYHVHVVLSALTYSRQCPRLPSRCLC